MRPGTADLRLSTVPGSSLGFDVSHQVFRPPTSPNCAFTLRKLNLTPVLSVLNVWTLRTFFGCGVEVHVHCSIKIANKVLVRIRVRVKVRLTLAIMLILSPNANLAMEQCTCTSTPDPSFPNPEFTASDHTALLVLQYFVIKSLS